VFHHHIGKILMASKLIAFSWKLLQSRISTKCTLATLGVILQDMSENCAICENQPETACHFFTLWFC